MAPQSWKNQDVQVNATCPPGEWEKRTYRSYLSPFPVVKTDGEWKYLQLDPDYIIGAMKINDATIGEFYPPLSTFTWAATMKWIPAAFSRSTIMT